MCQGWAKHYRFCNDREVFETIDKKISKMIGSFIGNYSSAIKGLDNEERRALLGVGKLADINFRPFTWPKSAAKTALAVQSSHIGASREVRL